MPNAGKFLVFLTLISLLSLPGAPACAAQTDHGDRPLVTLILEHKADTGWNRLLRAGLERAARDFKFATYVLIASTPSEQESALREAAGKSALVIVASTRLHELLRDNAGNFRKTMFGCVDAGIRAPNIMSVSFADEQAAFLAGAAAAMLARHSQTGIADPKIAWLSGEDSPAMRSLFNGYAEGAALIAPGMRVIQQIVGSFDDPTLAAEKTRVLLDAGALVIALAAGAGNSAALRIIEAAKARAIVLDAWPESVPWPEPSAQAGGVQSSGHLGSASPAMILGIVKRADQAVYEIAASAAQALNAQGKFRGKEILIYDLANGGVGLAGLNAWLVQNQSRAPTELGRRIKELHGELTRGAIHIKSLRERALCDCLD